MPFAPYQQLLSKYSAEHTALNEKLGWLSFIRLVLFAGFIGFGYYYLVHDKGYWLITSLVLLAAFLYCIRLYDIIKRKADFAKALIAINSNEMLLLNGETSPYAGGKEYIDTHHPYSYDLDIFGESSLYGFLNRATTSFGKESLARALLHPATAVIKERQESIHELSGKINFRQHIQATGSLHLVEQKDMNKLKNWLQSSPAFPKPLVYYLLLIFPVATITALVLYFFSGSDRDLNLFFGFFVLNLVITSFFIRKMLKQSSVSATVTKVLQQFAQQLKEIEKQSFESPLLKELQSKLKHNNITAAHTIDRLASLFKYLDFIINLLVSSLLNGLFLFHIHILFSLDKWKKENSEGVMNWLKIIGEFEALNCFANLSFNNREFLGYRRQTGRQ